MNVILITLDALSARYMEIYKKDHFSPYFKEKAKTPNIKNLLDDSVLYNNCYTNSNMTIVSTRELLEARMFSLPWERKFSPNLPFSESCITKILKKNGYRTGAILGRGESWVFDGYVCEFDWCETTEIPFDGMVKMGKTWIDKGKDANFFLWMHSKETHMSFNYQFYDVPYYNYLSWENFNVPEDFICLKNLPKDKNMMLSYAKSISFCDTQIGSLISFLKDSGVYEDTLIIISSDHGSSYGDIQTKNYAVHSNACENVFNIPLIVKYPKSRVIGLEDKLCQTIDIPYTILDVLGLKKPTSWEGESLLDLKKSYVIMECNPEIKMFGIKTRDYLCQYLLPEFKNLKFQEDIKHIYESIEPFLYANENPTVDLYKSCPEIILYFKKILEKHY